MPADQGHEPRVPQRTLLELVTGSPDQHESLCPVGIHRGHEPPAVRELIQQRLRHDRAGSGDVLIAMTFKPWRAEVVEAVRIARDQDLTIIGISDSLASPLLTVSDHGFIVQSDTPQFFPSTVATMAFLETLMAFVVADADPEIVANIERFHDRRHRLGIYCGEGNGG